MDNVMLGQLILKQADTYPESFSMRSWGYAEGGCGTIACLAGHAMLFEGYALEGYEKYCRPDGSAITEGYGNEAQRLLGMSDAERFLNPLVSRVVIIHDGQSRTNDLFCDIPYGLERFRALVEKGKDDAV
jgi:hypothetical protein